MLATQFLLFNDLLFHRVISPDSGLSLELVLHRIRVLRIILDGGIVFHNVGQTYHHLDTLSPAVVNGGFGRRGHIAQLYAQASSWPTGIALHSFPLFVRFIRPARGRVGRIDVFAREPEPTQQPDECGAEERMPFFDNNKPERVRAAGDFQAQCLVLRRKHGGWDDNDFRRVSSRLTEVLKNVRGRGVRDDGIRGRNTRQSGQLLEFSEEFPSTKHNDNDGSDRSGRDVR